MRLVLSTSFSFPFDFGTLLKRNKIFYIYKRGIIYIQLKPITLDIYILTKEDARYIVLHFHIVMSDHKHIMPKFHFFTDLTVRIIANYFS